MNLATMPFNEAAEAWFNSRRPYLAPKTLREYRLHIRTLGTVFGNSRLADITADQIRNYQEKRLVEGGPYSANHEFAVLRMLLKRINRWQEFEHTLQKLPLPKGKRGRVLSQIERKRLFDAAAWNPRWQAAYLFAVLSINTTAGPKEILTLRWRDINLIKRTITIQPEGAKNAHRARVIPLNIFACEAMELVTARAWRLGSCEPDHYLFPRRVNKGNIYDPTSRQMEIKTAWRKLRKHVGLDGLRMYDLRHCAITDLLEDPNTSEETAESIAGHIDHQMKKNYSHVRLERMRIALDSVARTYLPQTDVILERWLDGEDAGVLEAQVRAANRLFDTSAEAIEKLRAGGVPANVILAVRSKKVLFD